MSLDTTWITLPLPEVLEFREGPGIMARDFRDQGVPLIRLSGLKRGSPILQGCNYLDPDMVEQRWSHFRVRLGDVLLSTSASLGEVAVVDQSAEGAIPYTGIIAFRPRTERIIPTFIQYALRSPSFIRQIEAMGAGSVLRHFGPSHLKGMTVDLPPVWQQSAIAHVLGALDDKIAINERIAAACLDLGEAVYLQHRDSPDWKEIRLAGAAKWYSGGTPRTSEPSYWGGKIPWISALSLKSPWIADSDRRLTLSGVANGTRLAPRGSVIFVVRGSSLKSEFRIGITQCEVAFGQDCKALVPKSGVDSDLLFYAIRSRTQDVLDLVDETSIGAGRLNTDLIGKLTVRVPSVSSDHVALTLREFNRVSAAREHENRRLIALRDRLLSALMSGEVRVGEAAEFVEDAT